jgi:hypothetical protein
MSWSLARTLAIVGACATGAAAQPAEKASQGTSVVKVSGCVERADQLTSAGGQAQALDVDSLTFVLMRTTRPPSPADPAPVGTSGSVDPAPGPSYWLDAPADRLTGHVGHEVEVSGTIAAPGAVPAVGAAPLASAPRLKVDAITTLSETCKR